MRSLASLQSQSSSRSIWQASRGVTKSRQETCPTSPNLRVCVPDDVHKTLVELRSLLPMEMTGKEFELFSRVYTENLKFDYSGDEVRPGWRVNDDTGALYRARDWRILVQSPIASAIRRMRGSRDSPLGDPLSFGRPRSLSFLFLCHADTPSSGSIGWKQRGNPQRKSEIRIIDLRRRNPAGGGVPLLWSWQRYAAKRVTPNLTSMASPCRAGGIPSRP